MSAHTPTDTYHATVDLPDNGEDANATNLATATKDTADNAKNARTTLAFLAGAGALDDPRVVTSGIKRFEQVANVAALEAIAVDASKEGEVRYVQSLDSLYVYDPANASTPDDVFIIDADGGVGRWLNVVRAIRSVGGLGLAWVTAAGRLSGPSLIPGVVDDFTDFGIDADGDTETLLNDEINQTTYQDTDIEFDVASCLIGDVIEVEICLLARLLVDDNGGTEANARGIVTLFMGQTSAAPLVAVHSVVLRPGIFIGTDYDSSLVPITLKGRAVCADEAAFNILVKIKTDNEANVDTTIEVYSPVNALAKRYRP